MKKQVMLFIASLGAQARYSGKDKTIYITEEKKPKGKKVNKALETIEACTLRMFGNNLPFTLKTNK